MASRREVKVSTYQCAKVGKAVSITHTLVHLIGQGGMIASTANGGLSCANLSFCPLVTERAPGTNIDMAKCDYVQALGGGR